MIEQNVRVKYYFILMIVFSLIIIFTPCDETKETFINTHHGFNRPNHGFNRPNQGFNRHNHNEHQFNRPSHNQQTNWYNGGTFYPEYVDYYNYFYNLPLFRYLDFRDRSVLYDPLVAPEKRVPADQYPYSLIDRNLINYPTRGYPDNYQQLGIVTRNKDEKILQLFGRPTFPKSNQWEYYVRSEKDGFVNKIPIQSKNQRELENGDEVIVLGMNQENGSFQVQLFNNDIPRYNPYTI